MQPDIDDLGQTVLSILRNFPNMSESYEGNLLRALNAYDEEQIGPSLNGDR